MECRSMFCAYLLGPPFDLEEMRFGQMLVLLAALLIVSISRVIMLLAS